MQSCLLFAFNSFILLSLKRYIYTKVDYKRLKGL